MTDQSDGAFGSPGPWEADQGGVWDANGADVATCGELAQWSGDCFHPFENAEANARLIASAPDLLAALEGIVPTLKAQISAGMRWDPAEVDAVFAAIALATGAAA